MPDKSAHNEAERMAKLQRNKPKKRRSDQHVLSGPPSLETMVFCANEADVQKARSLSRPRLEELGFSWEADVEEVSPVIGTSNFRWLKEALTRIELEGNHLDSELPHGLLFRVEVSKIKATGNTGCVVLINHAVWDAVTSNYFSEDLELSLAGLSRPPRTPYKAFADTYFLHRSSLTAGKAIDFHLHRLRNLGSMSEALWPPTSRILSRRLDKDNNASINGISREFRDIPVFNRSQSSPSTSPSIIVKAAVAIFNTRKTGSNFAIQSVLLAARRWPFLEKGLADLLPSPFDIAGPTMTHAVDVIKVDGQETVNQMLSRLHHEQRLLSHFAHVPPEFIASLSDESRAVYTDALLQFYNWLPAGRVYDKRVLQLVEQRGLRRPSRSFVWELSRALEGGEVMMRILYDAALFEPSDVESFGLELVDIIRWLCDQNNCDTKIMHMPSFTETSHKHQQPSAKL